MRPSWIFLLLTPPVALWGLWMYRDSYRRHGMCTGTAMTALLAGWLMPHCVIGFSVPVIPAPEDPLQYTGVVLLLAALAGALLSTLHFRSVQMLLGRDTRRLVWSGVYRFSRNPQHFFYGLFLLGYAMTGGSQVAYAGVALMWIVMHFTVVVEEEHLERQFGEEYRLYKRSVPRYIGLRRE